VPLDAIFGEGFFAFVHPEDLPHTEESWRHALATGQPYEAEYRLRRSDGVYRWHLARAVAYRDGSGAIRSWYGSLLDVDDRRRAEEALRDSDRRKDEFLTVLSHELRNPLAPIRHALEVQARAGDDIAAWSEMRDTMERQVTHLVRLVDDLLDVSRLTTGRITLRRHAIDVRDVVADSLASCSNLLDAKRHRVTRRLPPRPLVVDGDQTRLVQVLTNILNNAAKFTPDGGEIGIVADESDGMVEIRVRDTGIGIPEHLLTRIFELFPERGRGDEGDHAGLGVGLTLARSLAELHGGTLLASSEGAGRGSEFLIRLPRLPAGREPAEPAPLAATHVAAELPALHVLIVDDYVDATRALGRLLRVMGHEVSVAHDGRSGIELAQRLRPDVILLDIGLPQMNGYSVAKQLRSLGFSTPIVALTGYGAEPDRERAREAGMDGHLVKPVDADDLEAALRALVPMLSLREGRHA
jgi:signal transduction histidine kinase/ActR/RegA family two-component response regulator